jgi:phosphomannomutase
MMQFIPAFKAVSSTNSEITIPPQEGVADETIFVAGEEFTMFTGNEIGVLLGHWQYTKYIESAEGAAGSSSTPAGNGKLAVVASTVSSKMLRAIAEKVILFVQPSQCSERCLCGK